MEMTSSSEQMIKYTYNAHEHTKINKEQFQIFQIIRFAWASDGKGSQMKVGGQSMSAMKMGVLLQYFELSTFNTYVR